MDLVPWIRPRTRGPKNLKKFADVTCTCPPKAAAATLALLSKTIITLQQGNTQSCIYPDERVAAGMELQEGGNHYCATQDRPTSVWKKKTNDLSSLPNSSQPNLSMCWQVAFQGPPLDRAWEHFQETSELRGPNFKPRKFVH